MPRSKTVSKQRSARKRKREEVVVRQAPAGLEQIPPLRHRVNALINARYPDGTAALTTAYDDRVAKRYKPASAFSMPWEHDDRGGDLEKPGYSPRDLFCDDNSDGVSTGIAALTMQVRGRVVSGDPIAAMGIFAKLSTEIRDKIFRYLLIHDSDIRVLKGWAFVFPRERPGLHTSVLRVCRVFYKQGVRILYGENTFLYLNRDPSDAHSDTETVFNRVYDQCKVPINKHGHLIRNIFINVEANRMRYVENRERLPNALRKFLPGGGLITPAQLHTITLKLPAMDRRAMTMEVKKATDRDEIPYATYLRPGTALFEALDRLNCQFIRIIAYDEFLRHYETLIDRRAHFTQLDVAGGKRDIWRRDKVMLSRRKAYVEASRARLNSMAFWFERLAKQDTHQKLIRQIFEMIPLGEDENDSQSHYSLSGSMLEQEEQEIFVDELDLLLSESGSSDDDEDDYSDVGSDHDDDCVNEAKRPRLRR